VSAGFCPKRPPDDGVELSAGFCPNKPPAGVALSAGFWPKRLPDGAALGVAGLAPNSEEDEAGADEAGAALGAGVAEGVAAGAGVEPVGAAAGVLPRPLNRFDEPDLGCSGALNPPNKFPDDCGCEDAAGAVDAGGAGVVDCDAAGVLEVG
jgi:hypothetical protein